MADREAHLVGSLPGETPAAAMTTALDLLGPYLRTLPDGETGDRRNWVISIVEGLREHPDLEPHKEGDWSDYDRVPTLRVRKGHRLFARTADFGYVAAVRASFPEFERAADAGRLTSRSSRASPATSTWRCFFHPRARPVRCVTGRAFHRGDSDRDSRRR